MRCCYRSCLCNNSCISLYNLQNNYLRKLQRNSYHNYQYNRFGNCHHTFRYIRMNSLNILVMSEPYKHQHSWWCILKNSSLHNLNNTVKSGPYRSLHKS